MRTAVLVLLFAAQLAGQPGSIDGMVVDRTSSKPLAGVHVRLYIGAIPQMAKEVYGSTTDADGRYSIATIKPGTYTVELEHAGFVAAPAKRFPYGVELVVHRGEHVAGLQLAMLPLVPLSGRVVNHNGDAVPDILVRVSHEGANTDGFFGLYNQNQTDEQGQFHLFVTPGKYHVIAGPRYAGGLLGTAEIRTDGTPDLQYAATYYPSALDVGSATPVEVKAGGEVAGLEIHMRAATGRSSLTLSGRVTGIPVGATASILYWSGDAPGKFDSESSFTAEADGRFSFDNQSEGYVRLLAQCCSPDNELQSEAEDIHLQAPGASDVLLTLAPGGVVTGKLEMASEDAAGVAGKLKVALSPSPGISLTALSGAVQADGSFRIMGVAPGVFTVNIEGLPDDGYIQAVTLDGAASDGTLNFSHGVRASRLKIAIRLNGGQISGDLRDADGGPTLSTRRSVYLVPEPGNFGPMRPDATIEGSHYVLKGIPPGKYKLFATDYSLVNPETKPAFLAEAEGVNVPAGGRVVHNLKMLEAPDADPKK